ncbi:hypothetical protein P7K49_021052, partial [Saguinus oedipus]
MFAPNRGMCLAWRDYWKPEILGSIPVTPVAPWPSALAHQPCFHEAQNLMETIRLQLETHKLIKENRE